MSTNPKITIDFVDKKINVEFNKELVNRWAEGYGYYPEKLKSQPIWAEFSWNGEVLDTNSLDPNLTKQMKKIANRLCSVLAEDNLALRDWIYNMKYQEE